MNKNFMKNIALFLSSVVFFLVCGELVCRFSQSSNMEYARKRAGLLAQDGSKFRSPLPSSPKESSEFRVLALGDSFTWGDGVEDTSKLWPSFLQRDLTDRLPGRNFRVINLGLCGLTTVNEFEILARLGIRLKPDMVIFAFVINDILPSGPNLARVGEEFMADPRCRNIVLNPDLHRFLESKSCFYSFLNRKYLDWERKRFPPKEWKDLYADDSPEWHAFLRALSGIKELSRRLDFKVLLVVYPNLRQGRWEMSDIKRFPERDIYVKVMKAAESLGLDVLDLLPVYIKQGRKFQEWWINPLDVHPSEDAYEVAAGAISDLIINNKMTENRAGSTDRYPLSGKR